MSRGPLWNPPGLPAPSWRLGTYAAFRARMQARAPALALPSPPGEGTVPLAGWNADAPHDLGAGLLGAWAVAADVLCFYQERLLNEGFLGTATEPFSVHAILRSLGYPAAPGIAASTRLAFTVGGAPGGAAACIPEGTAVQSVPVGAGTAQTFETGVDVPARPEWNAMAPFVPTRLVRQALAAGDAELRLAGVRTGLQPGDPVLLDDAAGAAWSFALAAAVEADAATAATRVTLGAAAAGGTAGTLAVPRVTGFGRRDTLYGHDAPAWAAARPEQRRAAMDPAGGLFRLGHGAAAWAGAGAGIPLEAAGSAPAAAGGPPSYAVPRAVLCSSAGVWLAAVSGQGVFRSADGVGWAPLRTGLAGAEVFCFAEGALGELYAGGAAGRVYGSADGGASWDARLPAPTPGGASTRLPGVAVRALLAWPAATGPVLAAGTDAGVYLSADGGGTWTALATATPPPAADASPALPGVPLRTSGRSWLARVHLPGLPRLPFLSRATDAPLPGSSPSAAATPAAPLVTPGPAADATVPSLAAYAVFALARGADGALLAGTAGGIFRAVQDGWTCVSGTVAPAGTAMPPVRALSAWTYPADGAVGVWAGTDAGVFHAVDAGAGTWTWTAASTGLGSTPPAVRALLAEPVGRGVRLLAGTASGVFVSADGGRWTPAVPVPARSARAAADPCAAAPAPAPPGLNNPDVVALAVGTDGSLLAATPFLGYVDPATGAPQADWPCFHLPAGVLDSDGVTRTAVDLDGATRTVLPGTRIVVWQPDLAPSAEPGGSKAAKTLTGSTEPTASGVGKGSVEPPPLAPPPPPPPPAGGLAALCVVDTVETARRTDFGLAGTVTRLWVRTEGDLARFDLRAASVFAVPAALALDERTVPDPVPLAGSSLDLAGALPPIAAGQWLAVSGARARVALAPAAGVFRLGAGGWTAAGLPLRGVRALLAGGHGAAWVACEAGVYATMDGGESWVPAGTAPDGRVPTALARAADGTLFAGTDGAGVLVCQRGTAMWTQPGRGIGTLAVRALALDAAGCMLAGTHDGVWRLSPYGAAWAVAGTGLPAGPVGALKVAGGEVYAASGPGGVYRLAGGAWERLPEVPAAGPVTALEAGPDGTLYAGTRAAGVFRLALDAGAWTAVPGLSAARVHALAHAGGALYAGTRGGVHRCADGRSGWAPVPLGAANDVRALAAEPGGALWAGSGARTILTSADGLEHATLEMSRVATLAASAAAALDAGTVPADARQALARAGTTIDPLATVQVRTPGRAWWTRTAAGPLFLYALPEGVEAWTPAGLPVLTAAPVPAPAPPAAPGDADDAHPGAAASARAVAGVRVREVAVLTSAGFAGGAAARDDEWFWQPAAPDDAPVGEVARAAACIVEGAARTRVGLQAALAGIYDPSGATVCANVAPATQGATVPQAAPGAPVAPAPGGGTLGGEVLGSGDATAVGQHFRLARQPLTYVPDTSAAGGRSTLVVRVDGAAWREVPALAGQAAGAAVYTVRTDATGRTTVEFGDGVQGARLPTGVENVRAWYRTGAGTAGNLPAGSITVPRARPAAVRGATNPVPATGGVDPETPEAARETAPLAVRTLGRVVSRADYADFARVYPGVSLARADLLRARGRPLVAVTVAGVDGAVPDGGLVADLAASIAANRLNAARFAVLAYAPLWFRFAAGVVAAAAFDPDDVLARAAAALADSLAFARSRFGGDVRLARLLETLQGVRGVEAVRPSALYLEGMRPALHARLAAAAGRLDPDTGAPLAAQILLPHPAHGLSLAAVPG